MTLFDRTAFEFLQESADDSVIDGNFHSAIFMVIDFSDEVCCKCDRAALHCPGRELLPLKLSPSRRVSRA
jgi:hypothetical protein